MHYDLPPELIAQRPLERRDAARLLVLDRGTGQIAHRRFTDLIEYLQPGDCMVVNRSKVVPARFTARRASGGRIPGLFVRELSAGSWEVLLTGVGRVKAGERLALEGGSWSMTQVRHIERGLCEVTVSPADPAESVLGQIGSTPLPPYIRRSDQDGAALDSMDRAEYQTVYAAESGSVAAPTAGLHFTGELIERVRQKGVSVSEVVLHVGLGTFQPIDVDDLSNHKMHREWYAIPNDSTELIAAARAAGRRVVAVGTTAVRVLETCARSGWPENASQPSPSGWTDILIYPPHQFACVNALVTNFHLPESTLLALVMAFAGREATLAAYREAIGQKYRFYSYGDAMLIL